MISKLMRTFFIASLFVFSASSSAVIIEYEITDLGGGNVQYDYTVFNNDLAAGIEEFSVFFDYTLFSSLSSPMAPSGWIPYTFNVDPDLPGDGLFGAFIDLASPIALGEMLSGFSVVAQYTGTGLPGSQFFEVYDFDFNVLAAGNTRLPNTSSVPEPGALALLLLGLGFIGRASQRGQIKQ